jgi:predicted permease
MPNWSSIVHDRLAAHGMDPAVLPDIVDELAQHAAQAYADARAQGLSDAQALERALAVVADGPRLAAEVARSAGASPQSASDRVRRWCSDAARDLRYALRLMRASPAFAAVVVTTIALGIGGTASIFTVVDAVLLRPLPYASPNDLVFIGEQSSSVEPDNLGYATFADWRARSQSYPGMALIRSFLPAVSLGGSTERVIGMRVSANYFRLLGAAPVLGRDFTEADDAPGHANVLMLSDGYWRRAFNADRSVIGRTVSVAGAPFTVIGVMPSSFEELFGERFYPGVELWAPLGYDTTLPQACRTCQHLKAFARLRPGVSQEAARSELARIQSELWREHPTEYSRPGGMAVVPIRTVLFGGQTAVLALLFGAVIGVLAIATLNVATLLLGRLASRRRELALRAALGAGWRVGRGAGSRH